MCYTLDSLARGDKIMNMRDGKMITLELGQFGDYLIVNDNGRDVLIQTDWDYPGVASTFGWCPCECGFTDGTVDCEHRTADDMIQEASQYILDHIGDTVDDPGYFN